MFPSLNGGVSRSMTLNIYVRLLEIFWKMSGSYWKGLFVRTVLKKLSVSFYKPEILPDILQKKSHLHLNFPRLVIYKLVKMLFSSCFSRQMKLKIIFLLKLMELFFTWTFNQFDWKIKFNNVCFIVIWWMLMVLKLADL